ncbi:hypothetical protein P692DRAFT_20860663 [Suillus brevipes Sb2]|nr:hypothetical protein P692DRAFT_20860663 [Suillus brevipes Sb2]
MRRPIHTLLSAQLVSRTADATGSAVALGVRLFPLGQRGHLVNVIRKKYEKMKGNLVNGIRATLFREFEVLNAHNLLSPKDVREELNMRLIHSTRIHFGASKFHCKSQRKTRLSKRYANCA